jgi:hypothetical protein
MKQIEIIVSPDGNAVVQTKGFAGASCQDASRFIERALGEKNSDQRTAEFYQPASEEEQHRQQA